jgi:hypothetical protein
MAAPIGNQFWRFIKDVGRKPHYTDPQEMWAKAIEYFQFCQDNPEQVEELHPKTGVQVVKKHQPFLKSDCALFLGFSRWESLKEYSQKKGFFEIVTRIEQVIYGQKLRGAAMGIYNSNIIARDLGLRDVSDVNVNDARKDVAALFPEDLEEKKN